MKSLLVLTSTLAIATVSHAADSYVTHSFKKLQLDDHFWSEGASFGDFNRDGKMDIVSGPYWYEGPDFKVRHEYYPATQTFKRLGADGKEETIPGFDGGLGTKNTYSDNFFAFVRDFNGDGWPDILIYGFPGKDASWFENPKGKDGPWKRHIIFDQVDNESPTFADINGDGIPDIVCNSGGYFGYAAQESSDPTQPWKFHPITPKGNWAKFTHGLGVGDVNGDGKPDIIEAGGWWEQPASLAGDPVWTKHPAQFGNGAQFYAYDVNGDGLPDVIGSVAAHGYGLAWWEQVRAGGEVTFRRHLIMGEKPEENRYGVHFSQLHALDLVDMDGDGLKDIVVGKRFWAHGNHGDPEPTAAPVVYWFQLVRHDKVVDFVPHLIDDDSGVGTQVVAGDVNGDGLPDVIVGNKKGTFVHLHEKKSVSKEKWEKAQPQPNPAYVENAAPPVATATAAIVVTADAPKGTLPLGKDGKPLNLDFEDGTLRDWTATGDAFNGQPIKGEIDQNRKFGGGKIANRQGEYWIGGYEKLEDKPHGTLTSAAFKVTQPWAAFRLGGGSLPGTRLELVRADTNEVFFTARGRNTETMLPVMVDLQPLKDKEIFIRIVDEESPGWGHVNFDDFRFYEKKPEFAAPEGAKPQVTQGAAANTDRAARQKESPVLKHLVPNPAKPTAVANEAAQKVISTMLLTPGFQAELIAAEPDVKQPVAFAIDERGRLWVAEAYSYPNKQPDGQGKDRIVIFEDVDGDGTFKRHTVFIEGLNLVSGLEVGFGGVWVGAAPEMIFIPKDANDKAGKPQVLLDGWGYQDTHETLNSFSWGPDGWLYGNQGVFTRSLIGKTGAPDAERTEMRAGVWRYHPVRHEFEIFTHGGSNQWGLDFNSNGHLFMTHCRSFWGGGGTTNVIRNGHFWNQANGNYGPYISNAGPDFAPDLKNYLPAAARYDSGAGGAGKPGSDAIYGGHSHVGTMIYLGDNWPDKFRDHLFTNNLFGHQMNHQLLDRDGSGYEAKHAGFDLLLAPDPQYMAVDLQTGPDGAVYLVDWCDLQHCHTPSPEKWDRTNGRIYRLSWAETYHPLKVDLSAKSDLELAQLHTHRNDWYSRHARALLQERAAKRAVDAKAIALLKEQAAGGEVPQILRAVWTLHVIGALDASQLARLAAHSSDVVRGWAVQLATEKAGQTLLGGDVLAALAKTDPSPTVRLALASALPMLPAPQVWEVATALAAHGEDKDDRFLPKMIWFGLAPIVADDFPRALALADSTALPSLADSICWFATRQPQGRDLLVAKLATQPAETAARSLRILAFGLKDEAAVQMPATWPQARTRFVDSKDAALENVSDQVAALFGDKSVLAKMRGILGDEKRPLPQRQVAFDLLKRAGDAEATPIFVRLLDLEAFRSAVIPLLSRSSDPATAAALIQRFEQLNPTDRSAALNVLTSRVPLALPLLEAVQGSRFDRKFLSALQVRQMRSLHDADVDRLLDQAWGKMNESSEAAKATIARLKGAYAAAPLWAFDAKVGGDTFNQICGVCHAMNGVGGKLGPDLGGSWRNGVDYFIENIVDPNAVVGDNFQLHVLTKKDGTVVSGLIEQETDTAIRLRTIGEPVLVAKADLKDHQKLAQSLMPPGLLEALPERKVIELLKFLTSKPKGE